MVTAIGEAAWARLCDRAEPLDGAALTEMSPMVVLAPHPDDETLGCGGLLATAAAAGLCPRVVYLTDGSASHGSSPTWSAARIAHTRRGEALAALAILGVPQDQIWFMDWPDGAPLTPFADDYEQSLHRLLKWLLIVSPKSVWAPRAGESHCDHQAATAVADDLARRRLKGLRQFDYLVWGWKDERLSQIEPGERGWRLSCNGQSAQRRRALASHRTQMTRLIDDAADGFIIPPELAALVDRPAEVFIERR